MTMPQVHPRVRRADDHRRALETDLPALVSRLQDHLGQAMLAVVVGAQPRTIARWIAADSRPSAAREKLLRDVATILDVLTAVDSPAVARAWFMGMNPQLDDHAPAEVLAEDPSAARTVMAAARAYVSGG